MNENTKTCGKCKVEKQVSEFYFRKTENRHHCYCKDCFNKYTWDRFKARKRKAVELMGGKCQKCGYDRCLSALEFHHLDPSKKDFDFGEKGKKMGWGKVIEELKKCILLCSNCHREVHASEDMFIIKETLNRDNSNLCSMMASTGECRECTAPVYGTIYCSQKCSSYSSRKVERPSEDQLKNDIDDMSFLAIGRKYGVSDNAVRKWAKQYGIPF